jgi:hypothetical protein
VSPARRIASRTATAGAPAPRRPPGLPARVRVALVRAAIARTAWTLAPVALALFLALAAVSAAAAVAHAAPLGIDRFEVQTTQGGQPPDYEQVPYEFDQAGGHPVALTSRVRLTSEAGSEGPIPTADVRDVTIDLPPGLIADPLAVPRCSAPEGTPCPPSSQVGVFVLDAHLLGYPVSLLGPLVDLTPGPGEAARLGMETPLGRFLLSGRLVRGPDGYGLAVSAHGLPVFGIVELQTTLWGVPAASVHDAERGLTCLRGEPNTPGANTQWFCLSEGDVPSGVEAAPFLTLPTSCSDTAPSLTAWTDSWEQPGSYAQASAPLAPLVGCNRLPFSAELSLRPDSWLAQAPVALELALGLEQSSAAAGIASAQLRGASIALPAGMTIDPSAVAGARGCPPSGPEGIDIPTGVGEAGGPLAPDLLGEGEAIGPDELPRLAPGHCPEASTIGTAEAESPLLARPLQGRVYIGAPGCGAPGQAACGEADAADGNLLRVYVELGGRGSERDEGVLLKLEGRLRVSPATGQLTLTIADAPQLPIGQLKIKLFGGSAALLDNPDSCAPAAASAELEPWGAPETPEEAASAPYRAQGCEAPAPFAPRMVAGSTSAQAGAFTPFTVSISRAVREQPLERLQLRAPRGVSAMLSSVTPCAAAAAAQAGCPAAARVGSSWVALGDGWQPLWLPGEVYLTGPYEGAPFGLAIVTRAAAGPLDLGQLAIRARLDVDPRTGALTITSDPLPRMALGVPLRLRELRLDIDRPGFIFNPTDCREQQVSASLASGEGALAAQANPFGIADCAALAFAPRLSASTSAATSIRNGASLDVRVSQPAGPGSRQANLAGLRIVLPRQLPTRLTALQAACPAALFAADAAACPPASVVGAARASTPLLAGRLSGPVYLVSHGHDALPAPTVVLEGQGLRLDLVGASSIERGGRTAISFAGLPDLPLRGVELYLPRGPRSALAGVGDLCASARGRRRSAGLPLPVALTAQNGIVLRRTARIAVRGCPP